MTTQAKNEQFRPCPLCGAEPTVNFAINRDFFNVTVYCRQCKISMHKEVEFKPLSLENQGLFFIQTENEVKKAWNRRENNDKRRAE